MSEPSKSLTAAGYGLRRAMAKGRRRKWTLIAWALLLFGIAASVGGGLLWHASAEKTAKRAFAEDAVAITSNLKTLLRRDADFTTTMRAVMTMHPRMSATRFRRWYADLEGERRQVGSMGTTVIAWVPRRRWAAFQIRRARDPAFRALVGPRLVAAPAPRGSGGCLVSAGVAIEPIEEPWARAAQGDWCAPRSPLGIWQRPLLRAASASGDLLVVPLSSQGFDTVLFEGAFYAPAATLRGWTVSTFDVRSLIRQALHHQRGLAVSLLYREAPGRQALIGSYGTREQAMPFTRSSTFQLGGTWTVQIAGTAAIHGLSPALQGILVLLGGVLLSGLLYFLLLVLTRSRERAEVMVEQKTAELRHQALHDALTGLPNRVLALDRIEQMLARARRENVPIAALYIDIDGFKHINDTFGHAAGDEVLKIVAERIRSVVRESDTAARLSGDEFVAVVQGSILYAGPELVGERLLEAVRLPCRLPSQANRELHVSASIGIASGLRTDADELLSDADVALHEAKATGKDRCVAFRSAMQIAAHDHLMLEMDLAQAIERDQLRLAYQPVFDLRSRRVVGLEALLRWEHPARGTLNPAQFIPIAEQSRLVVPIGRWVLEQACREAVHWSRPERRVCVGVNISGRQLDEDQIVEDVRHALRISNLEPACLTLEVTETALVRDPEDTAARLRSLKDLGVAIAIDDFGTGYSSLAYLRELPADAVKIDRSFIGDLCTSEDSSALIHTLVELAHALNLDTVAEGIEEPDQLSILRREHCDLGQGFLFSEPLDAASVDAFLQAVDVSRTTAPDPVA